jgi:predicted nucleotidyltransferase
MKRQDALRILKNALPGLKKTFGVQDLALFGSVARDEAGPESDIDILIVPNDNFSLFDLVELKQELESILGTKVDLGTWDSLNPKVRPFAERDVIHVA